MSAVQLHPLASQPAVQTPTDSSLTKLGSQMDVPPSLVCARAAPHTRSLPFPMQALLDRMGPQLQGSSWGRFMPPTLLERQRHCTLLHWVGSVPAIEAGAGEVDSEAEQPEGLSRVRSTGTMQAGSTSSEYSASPDKASLEHGAIAIRGHVWLLSQDAKGCRVVQEAIQEAASEEARAALAAELHGHVAKAFRCPHANHVLQKCIAASSPEQSQFVIDELLGREGLVGQASRHRYGCRVVQQLMRRCPSAQVQGIADLLLEEALAFSCHPFANFVMQQLLEHGTELQRSRLVHSLACDIGMVARSSPGCNVLGVALAYAPAESRATLARAILQDPTRLRSLAATRAGQVVLQRLGQRVDLSEEHLGSPVRDESLVALL